MSQDLESGATGTAGQSTQPRQVARPRERRVELRPIPPEEAPEAAAGWTEERPSKWRHLPLVLLLLLPVSLSVVYHGLIAADVYVSEAKFIVRATARSDAGSMNMLMQGPNFARSTEDTYVVSEYMMSRDIAALLAAHHDLREVMGRPEADFLSRYPRPFGADTAEQFFEAFEKLVSIETADDTGISVLKVRAYRPEDAEKIAHAILGNAESFVNQMNTRANRDALSFTEQMEIEAKRRMVEAERAITEFRNRYKVVNPEKETTETLAGLAKLQTEISRLEAALAQQRAMAPDSPGLSSLQEQINSLKAEYAKGQRGVAGGVGSMASKLQDYDMLVLERDLAARSVAAAVGELEKTRQEANAQRIYLQTIVEPNLPDHPRLPHRLLDILLVAAFSGMVYKIVRTLLDGVLDHGR